MIWHNFSIGFWHPFGPHAEETPEEILYRKKVEIESNGWTLWSFQYRKTLTKWFELINSLKNQSVYTLCSDGIGAREPKGKRDYCRQLRKPDKKNWEDIPPKISVPHPMSNRDYASAFVVKRIIDVDDTDNVPPFRIEWFHTERDAWISSPLPTRPEYLIRRGGSADIRRVRAVLELEHPYIVTLRR